MKKLIMGFCLLSMTAAYAGSQEGNKLGKKAYERDYPVIWSTQDNIGYITSVAEKGSKKRPDIKGFNSVVNFKRFCTSMEAKDPDIVATSRNMNADELERCRARGVTDVIRIKLGDEVLVFVADKAAKMPPLSEKILWRAFSKDVFSIENTSNSQVVSNPHKKWKDLDKSFADTPIRLLKAESADLDSSFKAVALELGCRKYPWIDEMKYHRHFRAHFRAICHGIRKDGKVVSIGEGDTSLADQLVADKTAMGLMMFTNWGEGTKNLKLLPVNGVLPSLETIRNGQYPLVRTHYAFIKKVNIAKIPRLAKYVDELTSVAALGESGYITQNDLVPAANLAEASSMVVMPVPKKK